MTRNFNWNFNTCHPCGTTHVHDTQQEAIAAARGMYLTDEPLRSTRVSTLAYIEELEREKSRNPHLLENRYA